MFRVCVMNLNNLTNPPEDIEFTTFEEACQYENKLRTSYALTQPEFNQNFLKVHIFNLELKG